MGLDNFWVKSVYSGDDLDSHPRGAGKLRLCGGMFSGHGKGSFRGKVYAQSIEDITGISIYEDLTCGQVKHIAKELRSYVSEMDGEDEKLEQLAKMFNMYARINASLSAWY